MQAKNKIEVIDHPFPDRFLIKIYPNLQEQTCDKTCDIIVVRIDEKRLWDLNLQIMIYNDTQTDKELVTIGSSKTFYKIIKNYKLSKINLY